MSTRTLIDRFFYAITFGIVLAGGPLYATVIASQDFGQTSVHSSTPATRTITYSFTGLTSTPSFSVRFGRDFAAHTASCSGPNACSIAIDFAPQYPGLSQDALLVKDAGGNVIGTTSLHGVGLGPEVSVHPGVMSTFAGSGWGYRGDGSAATSAKLALPQGVAVDPLGNVYIADSINQVIRKVDTNGIITTVVGNGVPGVSPDGTPATQTSLNTPVSVALDGAGNLYIADSGNNLIRKVSAATGLISTVAGGGTSATQTDHIGDGGPATAAILSGPADMCVDATGNVYIADSFHGLVRKVDTSGIITIFAGGGSGAGSDGVGDGLAATSAILATPSGVTADAQGNVYIADSGHNMIRFVQVASGVISAIAGTGTYDYSGDSGAASSAHLANPEGIRLDAAGDLFIADYGNNVVREVFASTGIINTVAGTGKNGYSGDNGSPLAAQMTSPSSIALDALGNLYIADYGNNAVRKVAFTLQNLTFNTAYVSQVSAPQTQTLFDIGNNSLTISAIGISRGFSKQTSGAVDCAASSTVLPGADCVLSLALYSSSSGNITGTLSVTTNSLNQSASAIAASLSGTAVTAISTLHVSNTQLTFGNQGVGTTSAGQTITLSNTGSASLSLQSMWINGTNAGSFQISNNQCALTLAAQSQCTLQITFTPTVSGSNSATVMYAYAGAPPGSTNVTGTGTAAVATVSPTSINFGSLGVNVTSGARAITLTNNNGAVLSISGIALSNALDFAITSNTCGTSLQPATSCTVSVSFTASATGARSGTLTFTDSASGNTQSVVLSGTGGTAQASVSPASLNFGTVGVGVTSTTQTVTLTNPGVAVLTISTIALSNTTDFTISSKTCASTLQPQANCTVSISFRPSAAGLRSGTLTLTDSVAGSPQSVTLSGTGGTPQASISPASLSFGTGSVSVPIAPRTVTLTNTGSAVLAITGIALSNTTDFAIGSNSCGSSLQPLASCAVSVSFTASTSGARSGTLTFTDSASGSPQSVALGGTGVAALATAYPATINFGTVGVDLSSGTNTVSLTNTSSAVLSISKVSLSNAADFSILSNGCTGLLSPQVSCTVSVSFTPKTDGARSGTLDFTDSAAGSTQSVSLTGTAMPALEYMPMTPCRLVDTRNASGTWGGPVMAGQTIRDFPIPTSPCGVPATAAAYFLSVAVVPRGGLGYLTMWPTGQAQPYVATINSDGRVKANAAIIPAGTNGSISIFVTNTTDVVLDISGYFVPKGTPNALAFYPLSPCRIVDTRSSAGPLGGPKLLAETERDFPVLFSTCGIPATAQAYSLNFAAVPDKGLGFLTTWPTGQARPNTSTVNAPTGAVTATATIAPVGTDGDISVFPDQNTHLVIDANGYFAPPGPGGYSYYNVTPCRVLDSRNGGALPIVSSTTIEVAGSSCAPPAAQAYVMNATVVPPAGLGYVTFWPYRQTQPFVATLNAGDGAITSNLAIIPASEGKIEFYGSSATHLVVDLFGFFD